MARLPKAEGDKELDKIESLIQGTPGLGRQGISEAYTALYGLTLAHRTLQRRLEKLVSQDRVMAVGEGPRTTYRVKSEGDGDAKSEEGYVPLSAAGKKLRDLVRRPIVERSPVGYERDWLFAYTPGKTWYLPKATRERLRALGRTPNGDRPAGTFARDILGRLLIDLSWASSRLEGNTYTRLDTQNLIEFGQRAAGKDASEAQMILNHKAAIELIVSGSEGIGLNRQTVLALHAALSENLLGDSRDEGRLRERPVNITGTSYTPTAIPQVIQESFEVMIEMASTIPDPLEAAFFLMVHLPYLQPFADVNKRTSRVAANIPLVMGNLCPLSFVDVPEAAYIEGTLAVYEARKTELLRDVFEYAYRQSSAQYRVVRDSLPEPDPVRLKYRAEIASIVSGMVAAMQPPRRELVKERARDTGIASEDLEVVTERALAQLINLNVGSAGRYRIRPGQFEAWIERFRAPDR